MTPGGIARTAAGLAVAAGLIARHAGPRFPAIGLDARLSMLPVRAIPVSAPVRIGWNDHMVPFIEAADRRDLATALGAVHMHLRAGQIEVLRRISAGRIAEMAGPAAIGIDRSIRMLGIASVVPGLIASLPDASREWAEAFLAGMNAVLTEGPAPPEFAMLGIAAAPWTLTDFFTLARLFSADLAWPVQRKLLALRDRTAPDAWAALWPSLAGAEADEPLGRPDGAENAVSRAIRAGSNAAAVSGARTASGHAIVGGDPHLGLGLPNPWLVACLNGGGISALGLMLPGVPFVALGRNRDIAWGGTSLHAASSEFVDLGGLPDGSIATRLETIRVRGGRSRRVPVRTSPHGPVVSDGVLFGPRRRPTALKWMGHAPSDELTAMLGLLVARDREDFRASLAGFGVPGQTMVYAGPDGIGRQVAAHLPLRPAGLPDDLVLPPDPVERAWSARADGNALFGEWDPPSGVIASANERLVGQDGRETPLGVFFAPSSRVERLRALLGPNQADPGRKLDADDIERVFQDNAQPGALAIRDLLASHAPPVPHANHRTLLEALRGWDGAYDRDSRGALAFELLFATSAERALGAGTLASLQTVWTWRRLVVGRLAARAGADLRRAVAGGLPAAARRFRRIGTWGAAHRHVVRHMLGAIPLAGRRFGALAFDGDGGNEALNKTGHGLVRGRHRITFGATARYVFDLADPDGSRIVLFGGQDGWPGSACFDDQIGLWRQGRSMRLPLDPTVARDRFPHVTVLGPAPGATAAG